MPASMPKPMRRLSLSDGGAGADFVTSEGRATAAEDVGDSRSEQACAQELYRANGQKGGASCSR
jgi:hypothetical protein